MEYGNSARIALIAAIVIVAGAAFVAPAYSYSSTVTTTGTITNHYITINVTDDDSTAIGIELTADNSAWNDANMTTDGFALTPKASATQGEPRYEIVAQSNKDTGSGTGAYLYGYFTGGGVGINTITLTVDGPGDLKTIVLHRDAPVGNIPLANGIGGGTTSNIWTIPVTMFTADTFAGLPVVENKIPITENGTTTPTLLESVYDISDLTFHFYLSWEPLLGETA